MRILLKTGDRKYLETVIDINSDDFNQVNTD